LRIYARLLDKGEKRQNRLNHKKAVAFLHFQELMRQPEGNAPLFQNNPLCAEERRDHSGMQPQIVKIIAW